MLGGGAGMSLYAGMSHMDMLTSCTLIDSCVTTLGGAGTPQPEARKLQCQKCVATLLRKRGVTTFYRYTV